MNEIAAGRPRNEKQSATCNRADKLPIINRSLFFSPDFTVITCRTSLPVRFNPSRSTALPRGEALSTRPRRAYLLQDLCACAYVASACVYIYMCVCVCAWVCVCVYTYTRHVQVQTEQSHVKLVAIGVLQTRGASHLGADHGDTHGRGRRRGQQARLHSCKWCTARTVLPKIRLSCCLPRCIYV